MTMSELEKNKQRLLFTVVTVGLVVIAGITGWVGGGWDKLDGAEALGTANAVGTGCDATQAVMRQEINGLNTQVAGFDQAVLGTPVLQTQEVIREVEVTREVTPTGLICYKPATAVATRTSTATSTVTRTATSTMEPTLAQRNTEPVPTNITVFVPTDTQAPTEFPTPVDTVPAPTATDVPPTNTSQPTDTQRPVDTEVPPTATVAPTEVPTATPPIPTPAPTNEEVIPTATQS